MSKLWKVIGLALLFGAQISFGGGQLGTGKAMRHFPGGLVEPFGPGFEVVSYAKNTGQLKLKFSITYFPDAQLQPTCDPLMMTVYPFDGLIYTGPETLLVPYQIENPYSTLWELTLPPNDTSYLVFREECGNTAYHYGITFVTTGDTLLTRWGSGGHDGLLILEWSDRHQLKSLEDYERAKREWEERQERLKHVGKSTTGHLPRPTPEDSGRVKAWQREITLDSLHKLEEKPLTDRNAQVIQVGDTLYIRKKGEYKFRVAETFNSWEEYLESRRNLKPEDLVSEVHIVIDLRDPEDYNFVKGLVDSLIPMEKPGYYHTVAKMSVIDAIKTHRIGYMRYPRYPGESGPPPKPGPRKEEPRRKDRSSREGEGWVAHSLL